MKISAYAASFAVVLCLAVAGCSDDDEPGGSSPTEKPSPTATATDSPPAPPALPAAARKKTAAGAEAFVKYYWAVVDYSQANGTTELLKGSSVGCDLCDKGIAALDRAFGDGATFRMPRSNVRTGYSRLSVERKVTLANVFTDVRAGEGVRYYGPDDPRNDKQLAVHTKYVVTCAWHPEQRAWKVIALTLYRGTV